MKAQKRLPVASLKLTSLHIRNNHITNEGVDAIARNLRQLEMLVLDKNRLMMS